MIITVLAGLVMIVVLVTVHELGHLFAARACGVGVLEFSIGFGPGVVIWRTKDFPIYLRFIPLGGYVRLKTKEDKKAPKNAKGRYLEDASWLQKIFIFVAGVGVNLALAVIIRTAMLLFAPPNVQIKLLGTAISFMQAPIWYLAPLYAIKLVFLLFVRMYFGIITTIWYIILPIIHLKPIAHGGIIGMISLGENFHLGLWAYFGLIYYISVILAVVNLIPLIPFDGGHIALTISLRIFGQGRIFKVLNLLITYGGMIFFFVLLLNVVMSDLFDIFSKFFKGG